MHECLWRMVSNSWNALPLSHLRVLRWPILDNVMPRLKHQILCKNRSSAHHKGSVPLAQHLMTFVVCFNGTTPCKRVYYPLPFVPIEILLKVIPSWRIDKSHPAPTVPGESCCITRTQQKNPKAITLTNPIFQKSSLIAVIVINSSMIINFEFTRRTPRDTWGNVYYPS